MTRKSKADLLKIYDRVGPFHEGLAWAWKGRQRFHIRRDGEPAYNQRFDQVMHFRKGFAWVKKDGVYFKINHEGIRVN
jgi:hypothetical protein